MQTELIEIRDHLNRFAPFDNLPEQTLDAIAATKLLPKEALEHLRYAFELLSLVRVRHQAREVEAGNAPSHYIEPEQFSASERQHLKEAFQVISNAQNFLRFRYPAQPASRPR